MTEPRGALIRQAGLAYFPIALIARLPFAMMIVGLLTLVVSARGSLSLAGAISAMTGLGTAAFGAFMGAAADRWGQRPVLITSAAANSIALCGMAWAVYQPLSNAVLLLIAFLIGATAPQAAPMSRSRLVGIITHGFPITRQQKVLGGAMAYESAADEAVFIFGPVIVGILATTWSAAAPILGAAALSLVFVTAFAAHPSVRAAERHMGHRVAAPVRQLADAGLVFVVTGTLAIGFVFGACLTALTAFMTDRQAPDQVGLVYGAVGLGATALALLAALFPARFSLSHRWQVFAAVLVVATVGMPFVSSIPRMAGVLVLVGIGIGPILVTLYHLGADRSPAGRSATVMTTLGSAITIGQAASSGIVGFIAQTAGTSMAMWVPGVTALVVLVVGIGNAGLVRRRESMSSMAVRTA